MADSAANDAVRGVEMQYSRVVADRPDDDEFFAEAGFRREVDVALLLVLLGRLRGAVDLGAEILMATDLDHALKDFDRRVPIGRRMRNVGEHLDAYISGRGHEQDDVRGGSLGVRNWGGSSYGNTTFTWAGGTIDLGDLRGAALDLYGAFRAAVKCFEPS